MLHFDEDTALTIADAVIFAHCGEHLTDLETTIFRGSWHKKTYQDIAAAANFNEDYLRGTIGQDLWRKLSDALGERVEKRNFRQALARRWQQGDLPTVPAPVHHTPELARPDIETPLWSAIAQPGALVRIKAPWQFGKTTVMNRAIHQRSHPSDSGPPDRTVCLNFRLTETDDFASLEQFLRWFCSSITAMTGEDDHLDAHWRSRLGNNKVKCMTYLEKYLLGGDRPLLLALDDLDRLFSYPDIAGEFLSMLRTFHEQAKTRPAWQQLRLLLVHTEVYEQLQINQSPFNVGVLCDLPEFTPPEVEQLAQQYGLDPALGFPLRQRVGGHPYLVNEALRILGGEGVAWSEFAAEMGRDRGPYSHHFRRYQRLLEALPPEMSELFFAIVNHPDPWPIETWATKRQAQKLQTLGLITLNGNTAIPRYPLYRDYWAMGDR